VIELFEDREALSRAVAELFVGQARTAIADHGRFSALLAGGDTPRRTYELLAQEPLCSRVPWEQVHLFWGDERCVPVDDPRSNAWMVKRALLDYLSMRPEQVHFIQCDRSPRDAAEQYEAELRHHFAGGPPRFDLAFLGMGDDGHTASLLPGSDALAEQLHWTAVTRRSDEGFSRVTVTAPLLNQAALVLFLVAGRTKARVLRDILADTRHRPRFPAQLIRPQTGDLRWFVDREAASMLGDAGSFHGH
jgi:6-phosphogluconolactonase